MKGLFVSVLTLALVTAFGQSKPTPSLVGTWQAIDTTNKNSSISFIFFANASFAITWGEDSVHGTYHVDTTSNLTIVSLSIPGPNGPKLMKDMAKINADTLRMQTAPDSGKALVWITPETYNNTGVFVRKK